MYSITPTVSMCQRFVCKGKESLLSVLKSAFVIPIELCHIAIKEQTISLVVSSENALFG